MLEKDKNRQYSCPYSSIITETSLETQHLKEDIKDLKSDTKEVKKAVLEMNNGGLKETLMKQNTQFMEAYIKYQEQMVLQEEKRIEMEKEDKQRNDVWRENKWKIISGILASILSLLTALISTGNI